MGISKLLSSLRFSSGAKLIQHTAHRNACGDSVPPSSSDHFHNLKSTLRGTKQTERVDAFLDTKSLHVDFGELAESHEISPSCPIQRVHASQLAANNPLEDRWNAGFTQVDGTVSSFIFTVIDGHSGWACSHALSWIVLEYMAAAFLDAQKLKSVLKLLPRTSSEPPYHLVRHLKLLDRNGTEITNFLASRPPPPDVHEFLLQRLHFLIEELIDKAENNSRDLDPASCLTSTLTRLDNELCSLGLGDLEVLSAASTPNPFASEELSRDLLHVAQSGAVGVFGHIHWGTDGKGKTQVDIANVGDCSAVLVSTDSAGRLKARRLTTAHQAGSNSAEIKRLAREHPDDSTDDLVRNGGRLLGELAPSRAFGDVRYKWTEERLLQMAEYFGAEVPVNADSEVALGSWAGLAAVPFPYSSPPYLSASPDVTSLEVAPSDRYLVLATDGLWDTVTPDHVARVLSSLRPGQCPATRLMRAALSTPLGGSKIPLAEDMNLAATLLSLPAGVARYYRDDITIVVVELKSQEG